VIRRGKEDRIRLLTYYIFSIFSKVGRVKYICKGRYGISHTHKGSLVYIVRYRYGYYSYSIHTGTCRTGGERRLHVDIDTGE
jgi:hypothetical protein